MAWNSWNNWFVAGNQLPKNLRGLKVVDYIYALIFPLKTKHNEVYGDFYTDVSKVSNYQSNIISFEQILNFDFGYTYSVGATNSIYITQDNDIDIEYMWDENEIVPVGLTAYMYDELEIGVDTEYFYGEGEFSFAFDFTVNATSDISGAQDRIRGIINKIKMAGKKYNIVFY